VFSTTAQQETSNPLIVIANYIFDSLPHDLFRVQEGKLQEGLIQPTPEIGEKQSNQPMDLAVFDSSFAYHDMTLPYYNDPKLDTLLADYAREHPNSSFSVPIGSLRCLDTLLRIAHEKLLLLTSDKAYGYHFELYEQTQPEITFHDKAFSMTVNFHAIGQYCKQYRGDCFHQSTHQSLASSAFVVGTDFDQLPEVYYALTTYLDTPGPGDLLHLYQYITENIAGLPLEVVLSYLKILHWDTQFFDLAIQSILSQLKSANVLVRHDMLMNLPYVLMNFYYLPGIEDTLSNLGLALQELGEYASALYAYQTSLDYFGSDETTYYNMALCYYFLNEYDEAISLFKTVVEMNTEHIMAKGWIEHIKESINKDSNSPSS
jgi:hypothetical protein